MSRVLRCAFLLALTACGAYAGKAAPVERAGSTAAYPGRPVATAGDYSSGSSGSYVGAPGADSIAVPAPYPAPVDERPGLGTSWGEQVWSPATMEPFVRASSGPWAAIAMHYNDRDGVIAH